MDIFGIGPLEFLFVLLIALLVFGPKDIAGGARTLGRALNRLYRSENYRLIQRASSELRNLPSRLAREANLDDLRQVEQELKASGQTIGQELRAADPYRAWTQPPEAPSVPAVPPQPAAAPESEPPTPAPPTPPA